MEQGKQRNEDLEQERRKKEVWGVFVFILSKEDKGMGKYYTEE